MNYKLPIIRIFLLCLLLAPCLLTAQTTYTVDISRRDPPVISGHLQLGTNRNPAGDVLDANNLYFTRNGKPWYPVMGEFHFSRYPRAQWEESILKMKAAGINVIASYIIWIHHEEEEGQFDWQGNKNLRAFAALCQKHDVYFFARIGPWSHGEVRNGGLPDWIVKRGNTRRNDAGYLKAVQAFYNEIGQQLEGLYFKDGGPVIGAQIENEYRFNSAAGLEHMLTLKKMAIEAGIDVPYYTATGWPASNQKQNELIPVWGAYPEAPWDKKTTALAPSPNYLFSTLRNDPAIGSDLLGKHEELASDYSGYRYPYATAEMGGGNQITYHRRPIIEAQDVSALAYVKVGSGANLMGYYMFHGGTNPIGRLSTMQESKATNYPNDYPILSYDFLSPIGEWGQLRPSYHRFRVLHTFLSEFGDRLVQYYPSFPDVIPAKPTETDKARFAVRSRNNSGFVFMSHYQRQLPLKDIPQVQFNLKLSDNKNLKFPATPITIHDELEAIFPFNMEMEGINLRYATAQPLCRIAGEVPLYVFFAPEGVQSEFVFDKEGITDVKPQDAQIEVNSEAFILKSLKPGTSCLAEVTLASGQKLNFLTLTYQQALKSWKAQVFGAERLVMSEQNLIFPNGDIRAQSTADPRLELAIYPTPGSIKSDKGAAIKRGTDGIFTTYSVQLPASRSKVAFKEVNHLEKYFNKGEQLPLDDRNGKNMPASPGPQYQTNLADVSGAQYWEIKLPKSLGKNTSDAFLQIDYTGDTGAAYLNGKLVADDFYSGLPMTLGLKRFGKAVLGKKLLLQIVPLTDERQIYFEGKVREPLKGKAAASLEQVRLLPQYEVTFSGK